MLIKSLLIHPNDTVAVVLEDAHKGDYIHQKNEDISVLEDIGFAHKIALQNIQKDEPIYKYGAVIGKAKKDIFKGSWVHENIYCDRGTKKR
ncbi:MAG: UxaA family hydrolase [Megasphaera sp.]|jgi:hypothetical protein|nr:UxaA family hydrolase [Megasphaera sp.]